MGALGGAGGNNAMLDVVMQLLSNQGGNGGLADLLPQVIDKLTPNGQLPQGDDLMAQGLELLKGKLFG